MATAGVENLVTLLSQREAPSKVNNKAEKELKTFDPKYSVGIDVLPLQTQNLKAKNGDVFNLLLVGESGLGKTTFVNTLFGTSLLPSVWHNVEEITPNVKFDKTTSIVRHTAHLTEDDFNLDFTVIDTPGFGDFVDNSFGFVPITNYIDDQLRLYMFQEEQPNRTKLKDNRVHACLYFIKPTSKGLSPLDIEALKHISNRVNLIPIISKADSLTHNELKELKKTIKEIVEVQNIKICEFIEDEEVKKDILKNIPYSIIGSESVVINEDNNTTIRGRKYKWGIAEVENEKHCDFIKLRDTLMAKNMVDLISSTESYYESCRNKLAKTRIKQARDTLEDNESIKHLNFDDPDKNGLQNQKILSKFNKPFVDELVIEWSPIFIQQQLTQKKKFTQIVQFEEKKFKDWKKALFAKQSTFNGEIEEIHQQIKSLNNSITLLKHPIKDGEDEQVDVGELTDGEGENDEIFDLSKKSENLNIDDE
ncbi:Septin-14 [Wickerhamomyces ciferrii]|uniref:Septin-14 n=1 Tax=Wickerhamomyces ciferrii (strain ATCC 14091 / BCRC 22168 / CBS 111 / JCM 3599 / NBRC 0793 / NRRL Y-1031 F-60-10) TaxID=1206466 RepID=K0KQX1_WICCF|nr:Septin-14 [Wickerhamomyces ciferrii]CCH45506.1 Septin-14 [Wickerhamomyces ciferrii]